MNLLPGEETLTDLNLIEIALNLPFYAKTVKYTRRREALVGADWEWWLGAPGKRWIGLRIQAKKLNPTTLRYDGFGTPHKALAQARALISSAATEPDGLRRFPLYCFYNCWDSQFTAPSFIWRCCSHPPSGPIFGCSLAPADGVMRNLKNPSRRFQLAELASMSIPWSCLACCPRGGHGYLAERTASVLAETLPRDRDLPDYLHDEPPGYVAAMLTEGYNDPSIADGIASNIGEMNLSHVLVILDPS